ncbi:MAG TPA: hypothetical protein VK785_06400, partial [Opitutaceae bacterium]|nr:hypothetical protein [Opitutaceae bacterium]
RSVAEKIVFVAARCDQSLVHDGLRLGQKRRIGFLDQLCVRGFYRGVIPGDQLFCDDKVPGGINIDLRQGSFVVGRGRQRTQESQNRTHHHASTRHISVPDSVGFALEFKDDICRRENFFGILASFVAKKSSWQMA